jgi:DNA-binding transcriptional LysR family regulator
MRLDRFDLNLLVALNVLLEERSVTRAADRLNLTQPAMSAALRRLRQAFNDELLVAHGKRMVPTPHAHSLAPMVADMINSAQALIASSTLFDPLTSHRAFRIAASDYITTILIRPLLGELATIAPNIRIEIVPLSRAVDAAMERGAIDCMISPEQFQSGGQPQELLFTERHVLLGWANNPIFTRPVTQAAYDDAGHVVVELSDARAFVEDQVRAMGDKRRIEVVTSSFTIVPWLLPDTNRIALVHERLARLFVDKLPLTYVEPPFEIPSMRETLQYHRSRATDGGLVWLKERLHHHARI